ncbi:MAG: winged helix-turn-helix transcriptional regulator [Chloroflexi bacterium]|nr:winged helix-turn-helix transcriptional regulator [Chloroflexota bacterium]
MPDPNVIVMSNVGTISVQLDLVQTALHSLMLITRADHLSGLNNWVYDTADVLTAEELDKHRLVLLGLHYAVIPTKKFIDFPAYLKHLENSDPDSLRDKIIKTYLTIKTCDNDSKEFPNASPETLLNDLDFFLEFLQARFGTEYVDIDTEIQAHALLNDPQAMKTLILDHLSFMWDHHLKSECARITPLLQDAVRAFAQKDFSGLSLNEAAKYITGQKFKDKHWDLDTEQAEQIIFVPSAHIGPYLGRFHNKNASGIIFGARLPEDTKIHAPDLSRGEITVRLSALADDIRLNILKLLATEGELRSQDIMEKLQLSQSAASRHLKQLSATGYLSERRCSGAKCYHINEKRIENTLQAVAAFLLSN